MDNSNSYNAIVGQWLYRTWTFKQNKNVNMLIMKSDIRKLHKHFK